MKFTETRISGVYAIDLEPIVDDRGFFARVWCQRELEQTGLTASTVQVNVGYSHYRGTLRGLHFQKAPHQEAKVVRCTRGSIFDVVLDLRADSKSFTDWISRELTATNRRMLYVPEGCAHGYQTLEDDTEIMYHTSTFYVPEAATGVRYDDDAFGIEWPLPIRVISGQDASWPNFNLEDPLH